MAFISLPSKNTKKWIVNFGNEFLGDIVKCFNLDLFSKKGYIKTGSKVYPHTTQDNITGLKTATAFVKANIDDGDAKERENKLWAVAENKVLKTEDSDFAFEEDESDGLEYDVVGENSDLVSVGDETGSDIEGFTPIEATPVNITGSNYLEKIIQLSTEKFAQSFLSAGCLTEIKFDAKKFGSPTDNLAVSIQEDLNGVPSGVALATYDIAGSGLTTSYVEQTITLEDFVINELNFSPEKIYWLVFERDGVSDNDNYYVLKLIYSSTTDPYNRGQAKYYNVSEWNEIGYSAVTDAKSPTETGINANQWTNPANAYSSNNAYATSANSDFYQDYYGFDLDVPTGAVIRGIVVEVEAKLDAGTGNFLVFASKDGTNYGTPRFKTISTTEEYTTFGDETDLWGLDGWTPTIINSDGFVIKIRNLNVNTCSVDHIRVKVYYYENGEDEINSYGLDLTLSTEFPSAEERLYLTTSKDVKFLGEDNGFWYSLWRGILQKDPLNSDYPAILKNLGAGGVLLLANDNKVHTMIATANTPVEAAENRLIFDSIYYINWAVITSSAVFLGLANKQGESLPSQVAYYEPYSERTRIFNIEEGATMGFFVKENCHIIDKSGQIRYFTGSSFEPYQYFPCYHRGEKLETFPHRNGIISKQGIIKILWKGQYPDPAGVWVLENGNLYHKHSVVFDKVDLNSYGALEVEKTGALFEEDDIYLGASLLDENGDEMQGIFSTAQEENVSVESDHQAVLQTAKFFSQGIKESWQDLALKYEPIADGEISIKQKKEPARITEGSGATAFNGIWTSDTTFTCADAEFASLVASNDIKVGDEVIVRKGQGAGILAHITDITGTTVTIDEGLSDISSGNFTFSVEAWEKITFDAKDTKYSRKASLKDNILEWKQFKIAIRKHILEEVQLISNTDKTLIKR